MLIFFLFYISELEIEECNEKQGKKKARVYPFISYPGGAYLQVDLPSDGPLGLQSLQNN